jgi:protein-tyrosine phosphatase
MTQVWERLFIGSLQDAEELATSNPHAITTVVTLCFEDVPKRSRNIAYLHYAIYDQRPVSHSMFVIIIEGIAKSIRRGQVLINCGAGMSRAPIMAAAWMHICGYTNIDVAIDEIGGKRSIIAPAPTLLKSIKEHLR